MEENPAGFMGISGEQLEGKAVWMVLNEDVLSTVNQAICKSTRGADVSDLITLGSATASFKANE